jgi:RNA polymerase sigma factor (sigma-70 family)
MICRGRTILHQQADVEDALHTVFARILGADGTHEHLSRAYLLKAMVNECLHRNDRVARQERLLAVALARGVFEADSEMHEDYRGGDEANSLVDKLMTCLPARCAKVVWLWLHDWSYGEIAEELKISAKTVSAHLERAKHLSRAFVAAERERERERRERCVMMPLVNGRYY